MQPIENRITNKLTRGVPGNRGVLSFSRRAHLLTTRKRAVVSLPLVGPCALRGGIALSAESARQCRHARGCWPSLSARHKEAMRPPMPPWKTCHWQLFGTLGIATGDTLSFCEKETKTGDERTVRTNGDLSSGSEGHQPRHRSIRCCRCYLYELLPDSE